MLKQYFLMITKVIPFVADSADGAQSYADDMASSLSKQYTCTLYDMGKLTELAGEETKEREIH